MIPGSVTALRKTGKTGFCPYRNIRQYSCGQPFRLLPDGQYYWQNPQKSATQKQMNLVENTHKMVECA
jgi:hypothetical protein